MRLEAKTIRASARFKAILSLVILLTQGLPAFLVEAETQNAYRWRNDDGSETSATFAAAANTSVDITIGSSKRLRMGAANDGSQAEFVHVSTATMSGNITANNRTLAVDAVNGYMYTGTSASPGVIEKIRISDMSVVATLALNAGERNIRTAVLDVANGYGYFATQDSTGASTPSAIVKVLLGAGTSTPTRIGALVLSTGETAVASSVIDTTNGYAYFGTGTSPGRVVKVQLGAGAALPTRIGAVTLNSGENSPETATIDVANGFAYFNDTLEIVKIQLGAGGASPSRVGAIVLSGNERAGVSAIDTTNGYLYTSGPTGTIGIPAYVNKIRLSDFTRIGATQLTGGDERSVNAAAIDTANGFVYLSTITPDPSRIIKVQLGAGNTLPTRIGTTDLGITGDTIAAGFDSVNGYSLFSVVGSPGQVAKVSITPRSAFRLQYGEKSTTCAAIAVWTQVAATPTTQHWAMFDSANITNAAATTDNAGLANGATTFKTGAIHDTTSQTVSISLGQSEFTELEYSVTPTANATVDGQYCFRLTDSGSASGFTYGSYGEATAKQAVTTTVTAPNGGESLTGGQNFNITWTSAGTIDHFRISLSTDGGSTFPTEITASDAASPFAWTVDNINTSQARIKVEAMDSGNAVLASDTSNANFTIAQPTVAVTAPNGGESLSGGQAYNITWSSTGTIDHYRILLSTDSGSTFPTEITASDTASPFTWTVPNISTTTARIRIEVQNATNTVLATDVSDADFSITPPTVTVTAPDGGESLTGGQIFNVAWGSTGTIDHFRILLSTDSGSTFPTVVTSSDSASPFAWTVPNITTSTARIRVEALDGSNAVLATDDSNADFSITPPTVTVTDPNGGETLNVGQAFDITWNSTGTIDHFRLKLSTDGGATFPTVIDSSETAPPYAWTVPNAPTLQARVRIEVLDASDNILAFDDSDADFTIAQPSVTLTDPNGGESLNGNDNFDITWTSDGAIDHYRILLSTDSGSTFPTVITNSDSASPFGWTVPNITTSTARVRVEARDGSNSLLASDDSDADFSIAPEVVSVTVTDPNGGEDLDAGQSFDITWTSAGTIDHYRISLSTDSGSTFPTVITSSDSASPFAWTVPNITTTTARIRIEAMDGSNVVLDSDDSDADFSITAPTVTVTAPNGGESLSGGQSFDITWNESGIIDHFRILLSTDGGTTFPTVIETSDDASPFSWTVNSVNTSQARIRIEARDGSNAVLATDDSDADFSITTIATDVTVTDPNGGESLNGGQSFDITWTSAGTIDHFRILLSTDSGATFPTVVTSSDSASPFAWTVPNITTSTARIRIEAMDGSNVVLDSDDSDADFSIAVPSVTVTDPDGGESLNGGQSFDITWTSGGFIDHYRILLSTDGGATFPTVITNSDAASPFAWTVNNVNTTEARIRIEARDGSNAVLATDDSDADFSITTVFDDVTVTAPNGGETLTGNSSFDITWTFAGTIDHYRILLSTDSGATFPTEITASDDASPFSWTVPNITTSSARVRIEALDATDVILDTDDSDADFSITPASGGGGGGGGGGGNVPPSATLSDPNGGEYLFSGQTFQVIWGAFGTGVSSIRLLLSVAGEAFTVFASGLEPSSGFYNWQVPSVTGIVSALMRIEALDAGGNVLTGDDSDAPFTIDGSAGQEIVLLDVIAVRPTEATLAWDPEEQEINPGYLYAIQESITGKWVVTAPTLSAAARRKDDGADFRMAAVAEENPKSYVLGDAPEYKTISDWGLTLKLGALTPDQDFQMSVLSKALPEDDPTYVWQVAFSTPADAVEFEITKVVGDPEPATVDTPEGPRPGNIFAFRLTITNVGTDDATFVTLEDRIPEGAYVVPGSITAGDIPQTDSDDGDIGRYDAADRTVRWEWDLITVGQQQVAGLRMAVPGTARPSNGAKAVIPTIPTVTASHAPEYPMPYLETATLIGSATDTRGVAMMEVYLDGKIRPLATCVFRNPLLEATCEADIPPVRPGEHATYIRAIDTDGNAAWAVESWQTLNPVPVIDALVPSVIVPDDVPAGISIRGRGFAADPIVRIDGTQLEVLGGTETSLTVIVPPAFRSAPGTHAITVFNPEPGGGLSNPATLRVSWAPVVSISSAPLHPPRGTEADVSARATDDDGITRIDLSIDPPGDLTDEIFLRTCNYEPAVTEAICTAPFVFEFDGEYEAEATAVEAWGLSTTERDTIDTTNPVPVLTDIAPDYVGLSAGRPQILLTGRNFVPGTSGRLDGRNRQTIFVDEEHVRMILDASDTESPADRQVTAFSPEPGGGESDALILHVVPRPAIAVSHLPEFPPEDGTVSIGARVTDPTGLSRVTVLLNTPIDEPLRVLRVCVFDDAPTEADCDATSEVPVWGSYRTIVRAVSAHGVTGEREEEWRTENPVPVVTSIDRPVIGTEQDVTIMIVGRNFVPESVAQIDGKKAFQATIISPTQIRAIFKGADLPPAGTYPFTVFNPTPGGGTSEPVDIRIVPPPDITISHAPEFPDLDETVALSVDVADPEGLSRIEVRLNDGTDERLLRTCLFVGAPTTASCDVEAVVRVRGEHTTRVVAESVHDIVGEESENWRTINPLPTITAVVPSAVAVGRDAVLNVTGTGFVEPSSVRISGESVFRTLYISPTELTAIVKAEQFPSPGDVPVTVFNPAPGGGTSEPFMLKVVTPAKVTPIHAPEFPGDEDEVAIDVTAESEHGVTRIVIFIDGEGFERRTPIHACDFEPALTSATCSTTIPPVQRGSYTTLATATDTFGVEGFGEEDWRTINPQPVLDAVDPIAAAVGSGEMWVRLIGSEFIPESVARLDGTARETRALGPDAILMKVTAADMRVVRDWNVTVFNPAPGGGESDGRVFHVARPPRITGVGHEPPDPMPFERIDIFGSAQDQYVGIKRIVLSLDGVPKKTCEYPDIPLVRVDCDPDTQPLPSGWHTVTTTAWNGYDLVSSFDKLLKVPSTYVITIGTILEPGEAYEFEIPPYELGEDGLPPPNVDAGPGDQPGTPGVGGADEDGIIHSQEVTLPYEPGVSPSITDPTPVFVGQASPGEVIAIYIDGELYQIVRADENGVFRMEVLEALASGHHVISYKRVSPIVTEARTIGRAALPVGIIAIAAIALAGASGPMAAFNLFALMLSQPVLLLGRRRRQGFGVVFNSLSRLPVDLAVVRVRDAATNRVVQTRVTDRMGRFSLFLPAGTYKLEIAKAGYAFPSKIFLGQVRDDQFGELQADHALTLAQETHFTRSIPVDPIEGEVQVTSKMRVLSWIRRFSVVLALAGPVLSAWVLLIHASALNLALFCAQLLLFAFFWRLAHQPKPKTYGVISGEDGKPLKNAVVRVVAADYDRVLESQTTGISGKYAFLVGKGRYYVRVEAPGYAPLVSKTFDFKAATGSTAVIDENFRLDQRH